MQVQVQVLVLVLVLVQVQVLVPAPELLVPAPGLVPARVLGKRRHCVLPVGQFGPVVAPPPPNQLAKHGLWRCSRFIQSSAHGFVQQLAHRGPALATPQAVV